MGDSGTDALAARGDDEVATLLRRRASEEKRRAALPDLAAERAALARLARQLADQPQGLQQGVADVVRELCGAEAVVLAVLEYGTEGESVRWAATSGSLAGLAGTRWPLADCLCGLIVREGGAVLLEHPARDFPSVRAPGLRAGEALGIPWQAQGRVAGALAAILPDREHARFDADDLALLEVCAGLAAAAQQACQRADGDLERQVEERLRPVLEIKESLQREVEERRAAERLLREHKALVDATLSIGTVGVVYYDLDGVVHDVNGAFERMCGYTREELRTMRHWRELSPPESWDVTMRAHLELAEQGFATPYSKQMLRKDGSCWWGLFAPARIAGSGRQSRCVMFVLDDTVRKQAEDALRGSEARFRALADAAPALVYQFDLDGNVIYLNQRGQADPPAVDGERDEESVPQRGNRPGMARPGDMDAYLRDVFDGIRAHNSVSRRIHTVGSGGDWHWFESHAAPWYAGMEEHQGYVGISLDITGSVQAEEALRQADRRKDEFLATLAHELRNPLAPISNAVQLLRRPDGRRQSDRVIEMVGRQVGQMIRLVDDLMEVSRIAHGKIDLKLERVPFAEIVRGAVESSQPLVERSNHQLLVSLPDEPLALAADRVRLTQVFANLLNNAAKYTDSGGRIWLEVRRDGRHLVASVRDTGIGIPREALPRVFDMFVQAHRATGRGHGGLGIGLTMVRSLVEMHHGTVEAHSAGRGKGSKFVVRLPLASEASPCAVDAGQAPDGAPFAGQRILVVDDNRDAADTLGMLLEADGAEVRVVYDGRAALAMAESFLPTGVLLDIGMPGMDGFEVARRLRHDGRFASLRIVALTGWGQDADRRQTRNRGFSTHLTKPVSVEELQRALNGT